jgi:hypothetical protein
MTMAKKGSRLITIDGTQYRWKVRGRPTYSQLLTWTPLTFAVENAAEPGSLLTVSTNFDHPHSIGDRPGVILPATVVSAVRTALSQGWQPSPPGPAFPLTLNETP